MPRVGLGSGVDWSDKVAEVYKVKSTCVYSFTHSFIAII